MNKKYRKQDTIVARKIGDDYILVPTPPRASDLDCIYNLTDVAARIWELLDDSPGLTLIRDTIAAEFDVDPADAEKDLREFLAQLELAEIIRAI